MTGALPFCWITADHQSFSCSASEKWRKVCSWEIRVLWLGAFVVLIILERRSATPSHTVLPFTHNTLTLSFACLCRHSPIRIHHTHRLSHADFDLVFCLRTLTQFLWIPLFFPLSRSFCLFLFLFLSVLHSYISSWVLPLRQQADRFWMSHPLCLIPSAPSVSPCPPLCAHARLSA